MNSYQKLKLENKILKNEIYKILDKDESTIHFWQLKKDLEQIYLFGSPIKNENTKKRKICQ